METPQLPQYAPLIGAAVVLVILALRMRRLSRHRRLRIEWLWVVPAILLLAAGVLLFYTPPTVADWAWMTVALGLGAGMGWYRGRGMHIKVNPETHEITTKASPGAMLFIGVLVLVKVALRTVALDEATGWHIDPELITDASLALALGLIAVSRLEMWLRARRLLDAARANSPLGVG